MTDDEYWIWALSEWNLDLSVSEIISLLIQGYEVNSRVVKTAKKIRENGYKTLICSNNFPARINGLQQRFQFLNDFDATVFSYEIGATKPSEKIFIELARRAKVETSGIVFADDNDLNLDGAKSIGILTFRYTTFDQFITDLKSVNVNL